MTETLRICTLGGFAAYMEGRQDGTGESPGVAAAVPLHLETRTAEALLVYVACQRGPVARELLAELLWPDRNQEQSLTNVRVALHRLRTKVGAHLLCTRSTVALRADTAVRLDSAAFEDECAAGRLASAAALYHGDFLDGYQLNGSPAFEHWLLAERERLRSLALSVHQKLLSQAAAGGQFDRAIAEAQALLRIDPLQEPAQRQLMRLLAGTGRRNQALSQFENYRTLLAEELDVEPDEKTRALYEAIRTGSPEPAIPLLPTVELRLDPAANGTHKPIFQPQPTPFLGRQEDTAGILALLHNPDCRMLTLLGMGGVGKTRLALEVASQWAAGTGREAGFVDLTGLSAPEFTAAAVAQSLGVTPSFEGDTLTLLAEHLRARRLLLVLDNVEHLLETPPAALGLTSPPAGSRADVRQIVTQLLRAAPGLKVLVTSRARVGVLEEWLWPVTGLSFVGGLGGTAAQLFVSSARRTNPAFATAGQESAITDICRILEGLPLGIELAAGWTRVMPCAAIAERLAEDVGFLLGADYNMPARHMSLRSVFEGSWRHLTAAEQDTLMRLSVFTGGWTAAAAADVANASLPILLALVDRSLVRTAGDGRFDLHVVVRQFAAERLQASAHGEATHVRHAAAFLALAQLADTKVRGADALRWLQRVELEQDNMRAALKWLVDTGRIVDAARLALALTWYWMRRGHWREAAAWLEQIVVQGDRLPHDLQLAVLVSAYWYAGQMLQTEAAAGYLAKIYLLAPSCEDDNLRVGVLHATAWYATSFVRTMEAYQGTVELARRQCAMPFRTPRRTDDLYGIHGDPVVLLSNALFQLSELKRCIGAYAEARVLAAECLRVHESLADRDIVSHAFGAFGRLALLDGDIDTARARFNDAVATARAVQSPMSLTEWLPWLGIVMVYQDELREGRRMLEESLELRRLINPHRIRPVIHLGLALAALESGELADAEHWVAEALRGYMRGSWVRPELVDCLLVAARLAVRRQYWESAAEIMGMAEKLRAGIRHALDAPLRPVWIDVLRAIRMNLPPELYMAAWERGHNLSLNALNSTLPLARPLLLLPELPPTTSA